MDVDNHYSHEIGDLLFSILCRHAWCRSPVCNAFEQVKGVGMILTVRGEGQTSISPSHTLINIHADIQGPIK